MRRMYGREFFGFLNVPVAARRLANQQSRLAIIAIRPSTYTEYTDYAGFRMGASRT